MGGRTRTTVAMRRIATVVGWAAVVISSAGCYSLQLSQGTQLPVGSQVALDITDAGRVTLGGQMGPEIVQVEGRLFAAEADEYVIAVSHVKLLRGGEQVWQGERVRVRKEHVSRVYERRFSRGRSVVAGALGTGAVLFIVTRAIVGAGLGDEGILPSDSTGTQRRPVRP